MSYSAADARVTLLDELRRACESIGRALAALTEAYEWVDEDTADRLEDELFRPVQAALGRGGRTHSEFAARRGVRAQAPGAPAGRERPGDARAAIEHAAQALVEADGVLATLQDSLLPVEVGDAELRGGLAAVRETISPLPHRARELLRRLGR